jgi:DNA adenine methylase
VSAARPFLKWAGGKSQLLPELVARAPRGIETYYEPFLGGGAMFFALVSDPELAPRRAVLNDLNRDLIAVYEAVRDDLDALIEHLQPLEDRYLAAADEDRAAIYYEERERFSHHEPGHDVERAARLIFLNKTCFNGLYRVNRRGTFNVPHGRYARPRILDAPGLTAASSALRGVELLCIDFEEAVSGAGHGDFVYVDPPFEPLSKTSSFTGYTEGSFDRAQQQRLKWVLDELTNRGARAMLSNSPQDYILGLYSADRGPLDGTRYRITSTPARRAINSRGDRRGAIDELIVTNYPADEERRALESA